MPIELTEEFKKAYKMMEESGKNIFITGKAGSGKSTLLRYFRDNTKKKIAVLAPTGVAALNIGGQTFHSFFRFKPDINFETIEKKAAKMSEKSKELYKSFDAIIIDEISMLRADLLDYADIFLRKACSPQKPFGGRQMLFFGDLYQLPPVLKSSEKNSFLEIYNTPYFFSAESFKKLKMEVVELDKIYRQSDTDFIRVLNSIRNNTIGDEDLSLLNNQVDSEFKPEVSDYSVTLTPRNDSASLLNQEMLDSLPGKEKYFEGEISGDFDLKNLPTDLVLSLKKDAQVMLLTNEPNGLWVNGSIGRVEKFSKDSDEISVVLSGGLIVNVTPFEWDIFEYHYDEKLMTAISEKAGSFIQYPLKLAWAITIHKSQGKTFERMVLDIGRGAFSPGQVYVALSRVKTLEGIILKKPLKKSHIFMDRAIVDFMTKYRYSQSEKELSMESRRSVIQDAINNRKRLEIVYLKASDDKTCRVIRPLKMGRMEFQGRQFEGITAYCENRKENRTFRIDRILEMKEYNTELQSK